MSDMPPSEYGGKTQKNGLQGRSPNGDFVHLPTASEKLRMTYTMGVPGDDEDDLLAERDEHAFTGGIWAPEGTVWNPKKKVWEPEDD